MIEAVIISHNDTANLISLPQTLLDELNIADHSQFALHQRTDGIIELRPISYPKGDIRRLKGLVKTDVKASIDEMNTAIAQGATNGECT